MYLIAGLGNPGPDYRDTRHNMGFRLVEAWAGSLGVSSWRRRLESLSARTVFHGRSVILLRPMTYMNRSGIEVRSCAVEFKIEAENILVVHDDLDLPLGRIRVARGGSAGGHKGVSSVVEHLGTRDFPRLKMGIGRPEQGEAVEEYVLSPFSPQEKDLVLHMIRLGVQACEVFVEAGVDSAMNAVNGQHPIQ